MPCTIHDLKPIDKSTPIPLYYQLKTQFKDMIQSGFLVIGVLLPSENKLVVNLLISRPSVLLSRLGAPQTEKPSCIRKPICPMSAVLT